MVGRAAATWCCVSILTAIITSRLDPCIALLGHRNDASFFGSTLDADRPGRRKGGAHVPSIERWSMAPGDKVQWSVPGTGTDKRGNSMLEEHGLLSVHSSKQGADILSKMDPAFKAAFENTLQVAEATSSTLKQMQNGACTALWGKVELVTKQKSRSGLAKGLNLFSSCPGSKFTVTSGGETNTWRDCAEKMSDAIRFFSWVRTEDATAGVCTLLGIKSADVNEDDVASCLRDANEGETAVSGYGSDTFCTTCVVGEWSTTSCSASCEAGISGRYRAITQHANLKYCQEGLDASCDRCPHLWETRRCNVDVKCGAAIQPGKHYCPEAQNQINIHTETWQECSEACHTSFHASGGKTCGSGNTIIIADATTFAEADCFRYSFHNTTSTCELKTLAECSTSVTADPLWISGDVLTMPTADYTTMTWSAWSGWSSCDGIDPKQGWKKRRREVTNWGFRNDGLAAEKGHVEVASCAASGVSVISTAATQETNATCCLLGDFVDWTEAQCDPVCGSDRYQIRKRRRLQNPVPNVDNEFDPTCDLNKCKQDSESAESRRCRNVPECTSDCVYLDWTEWSACTCMDAASESGSQMRMRKAISGTICPDMSEQQQCTHPSCKEEDNTMTYIYAASGGVAGLLLLGGIVAYRNFSRGEEQQAQAFETL